MIPIIFFNLFKKTEEIYLLEFLIIPFPLFKKLFLKIKILTHPP